MNVIKSIPMLVFLVGFIVQIYAKPNIVRTIEYLEKHIARIQRTVDNSGNAEAVDMLSKAEECLQNAKNLNNTDDKNGAWKEINKAHRYVNKAYRLAREPKKGFKKRPMKPKGKKGLKDPAEMVAKNIKRMENYIGSATKIVEETGIEKAKVELASGIQHFETAKTLNKEGKTEEAMKELRQASKSIKNAIRIAKQPKKLERMIKHLDKVVEKFQETVNNSDSQEAKDLLAKGVVHFERGKQLFQDGDITQAKVELNSASKYIYKAIRMVKTEKKKTKTKKDPAERIANKIKRMEKQIESVTKIVEESGIEEAKVEIEAGKQNLENANGFIAEGKTEEAMKALKQASKSIHNAVKIAKLPKMIEKMIKHSEKVLEKIQETVNNSESQEAKDLLAKGVVQLEEGKQLFQDGNMDQAKFKIKNGLKLIHRAARIAHKAKKG